MSYLNTKATLTVLFATSLVISNVTASKVAEFDILGGLTVPAGFVAIGVAFLVTDLINELYGREYARSVVNGTVIGLLLAWVLIYVSISMPAAPFYPHEAEYALILGESATIVAASIITILVSQNLDVVVFDEIKKRTGDSYKFIRNIGSTSTSQLVDTALFISLGFWILPQLVGGEVTPLAAIPGLIAAQYAVKLIVVGLDTPLFYLGSYLLSE